jgi:hypothetical protein
MACRILLALLVLSSCYATAQDRPKLIYFETGFDGLSTEKVEKDYLRVDKSFNSDYETRDYQTNIRGYITRAYAGVKLGLRLKNDKYTFLTGLRYTQITSSINKKGPPDYFYLLHQQSGTTTEYLRVEELRQSGSYLSVPVEIRMDPWGKRRFSIFFMAGGEVGLQIAQKNKVRFSNSAMNQYESDVSRIMGKSGSFYSAVYGRAGITFGKEKPLFSLGVTVPLVISSTSTLTTPEVGGGINLQIQKTL